MLKTLSLFLARKKLSAVFANLKSNSWALDFRITTEEGLGAQTTCGV